MASKPLAFSSSCIIPVILILLLGGWKLAKLFWAAISN